MKLVSIRFLGTTQLITEGTAIDLANQLAAKDIRPDFSMPDDSLNKASYLFYLLSAIMLSLSIYLNVFYK